MTGRAVARPVHPPIPRLCARRRRLRGLGRGLLTARQALQTLHLLHVRLQIVRVCTCHVSAWTCRFRAWTCRFRAWTPRFRAWTCRFRAWTCRFRAWTYRVRAWTYRVHAYRRRARRAPSDDDAAEVLDRPLQPLFQRHDRLPLQERPRLRDVG